METPEVMLQARGVGCSRASNTGAPVSVRGISLSIPANSTTLLAGDECGGKNLLLRLLGLLEAPDGGEILFRGASTSGLSDDARAELRNRHFGFLFAEPFLLPTFSVAENVAMPLFKISGVGAEEARKRTEALLEFAGIGDFGNQAVGALDRAEQQRVSLARALVNKPEVLIIENVDEGVTGADLDGFIELIQRANSAFGTTAILTARDQALAKFDGRVVELAGGAIVHDSQIAVEHPRATA